MPYKDKQKQTDKAAKWNKENKEKRKIIQKRYTENNKESINDYRNEFHHLKKICDWKNKRGIKLKPNEDWESVYLYWKTCERCELCDVELTDGTGELTSRNLDHDHDTGFIRDVLCWGCNIKRR